MGRKLRHRQAKEKAKQGKLVQKAKDQANSKEEPVSAAETIVKIIRTETSTNCKEKHKKLNAWLHRADRSGPPGDGHQTCGVMFHKGQLFGGELSLLILPDLNVLHVHTTRRARGGS
jgi:hypothetical protein